MFDKYMKICITCLIEEEMQINWVCPLILISLLTLQRACELKLMHVGTVQFEDCLYIKKSPGMKVVTRILIHQC